MRHKRAVYKILIVCIAALFTFAGGCERATPLSAFVGGALHGTWEFHKGQVRLADAPGFTTITIDRKSVESEGLFGRIAFFPSGRCAGEFINEGTTEKFTGEYETAGNNLSVKTGNQSIQGIYGLKDGELLIRVRRTDEGVTYEVTLILRPAADAIPEPAPEPDPGTPGSDGGSGPSGGSSTFLWKPKSENDGKAVTLFPWKYRLNNIEGCHIEGGSKDGDKATRIYWPDGRNGNRVHARWGSNGGDYGKDFKVVLELKGEDDVSWGISDGSKRKEIN